MSSDDVSTESSPAAFADPGEHPLSPWDELKTVLVAVDGSRSSMEAADFAVELAAEHRAELIFVHVVATLDLVADEGYDVDFALPHEPSQHDRSVLDNAAEVAAAHGVVATTALLGGSAAEEIVAYGDERGVDLIVVGSRGHGALARTLLGSVSLRVLRQSTRPVLIVRSGHSPQTANQSMTPGGGPPA